MVYAPLLDVNVKIGVRVVDEIPWNPNGTYKIPRTFSVGFYEFYEFWESQLLSRPRWPGDGGHPMAFYPYEQYDCWIFVGIAAILSHTGYHATTILSHDSCYKDIIGITMLSMVAWWWVQLVSSRPPAAVCLATAGRCLAECWKDPEGADCCRTGSPDFMGMDKYWTLPVNNSHWLNGS